MKKCVPPIILNEIILIILSSAYQERRHLCSAERRWQVVNNPLNTFILKYLFSTSLRPFHVFIHTL